jgi:hypothetical protein
MLDRNGTDTDGNTTVRNRVPCYFSLSVLDMLLSQTSASYAYPYIVPVADLPHHAWAGLIKIRGDEIWRNGTALYYQFETQPMPGLFSRWFHFLPKVMLKAGVWFNHFAELVAPWFVFWPRVARHIAGVIISFFK